MTFSAKAMVGALLLGLAVAASGCHGRSVDHWLQQLSDPDASRRREAIRELSGADANRAVPALTAALRDENHYVRREAATALGKFGSAAISAVPALTAALKDSEKSVRAAAQTALKRIDSRAAGEDLRVADQFREVAHANLSKCSGHSIRARRGQ
jgi:HEAT repeat protein